MGKLKEIQIQRGKCNFALCNNDVVCTGFCRKHLTAHYRGYILKDGTPLDSYKPRITIKKCTFKDCKRPHHSKGLCNLHRKRLYKGYIDKDHNILNPEKCKERPTKCKVCGRSDMKGQGFCKRHYASFYAGILDKTGDRLKPIIRYPKDFQCIVPSCFVRGGKFARGMCKRHHNMARAGIIDWQGIKVRELKRVNYKGKRCKICPELARSKNFCRNHWEHLRAGNIDITGKWLKAKPIRNKGKKCIDPECYKEAKTKLMCPKHYARIKSGFAGYKNSGHKCSEEGCQKPATARTLCHSHYRKLRISEKLFSKGTQERL